MKQTPKRKPSRVPKTPTLKKSKGGCGHQKLIDECMDVAKKLQDCVASLPRKCSQPMATLRLPAKGGMVILNNPRKGSYAFCPNIIENNVTNAFWGSGRMKQKKHSRKQGGNYMYYPTDGEFRWVHTDTYSRNEVTPVDASNERKSAIDFFRTLLNTESGQNIENMLSNNSILNAFRNTKDQDLSNRIQEALSDSTTELDNILASITKGITPKSPGVTVTANVHQIYKLYVRAIKNTDAKGVTSVKHFICNIIDKVTGTEEELRLFSFLFFNDTIISGLLPLSHSNQSEPTISTNEKKLIPPTAEEVQPHASFNQLLLNRHRPLTQPTPPIIPNKIENAIKPSIEAPSDAGANTELIKTDANCITEFINMFLKNIRANDQRGGAEAYDCKKQSEPKFESYCKMQKMRVPAGGIKQKMLTAGLDQADINRFFGEEEDKKEDKKEDIDRNPNVVYPDGTIHLISDVNMVAKGREYNFMNVIYDDDFEDVHVCIKEAIQDKISAIFENYRKQKGKKPKLVKPPVEQTPTKKPWGELERILSTNDKKRVIRGVTATFKNIINIRSFEEGFKNPNNSESLRLFINILETIFFQSVNGQNALDKNVQETLNACSQTMVTDNIDVNMPPWVYILLRLTDDNENRTPINPKRFKDKIESDTGKLDSDKRNGEIWNTGSVLSSETIDIIESLLKYVLRLPDTPLDDREKSKLKTFLYNLKYISFKNYDLLDIQKYIDRINNRVKEGTEIYENSTLNLMLKVVCSLANILSVKKARLKDGECFNLKDLLNNHHVLTRLKTNPNLKPLIYFVVDIVRSICRNKNIDLEKDLQKLPSELTKSLYDETIKKDIDYLENEVIFKLEKYKLHDKIEDVEKVIEKVKTVMNLLSTYFGHNDNYCLPLPYKYNRFSYNFELPIFSESRDNSESIAIVNPVNINQQTDQSNVSANRSNMLEQLLKRQSQLSGKKSYKCRGRSTSAARPLNQRTTRSHKKLLQRYHGRKLTRRKWTDRYLHQHRLRSRRANSS